jgi:heme-degrading monooxygenase HmoA
MIAIVWRFRVAAGETSRFEEAYGSNGAWAALFREALGYVRTELLRAGESEFLTIDYWADEAAWEAFSIAFHDEYERLDRICAPLTVSEDKIGVFAVVE